MLRLLRREEKNHLRSQLLENNLIFKAFQAPVREYEIKHTKGYHMSPEEVFWSIVIKLDYIKEHQEDAMQDIRSLWNDVYMDYHDLSSDDNDETVSLFASLTVFALQVCLLRIDVPLYRQMALNLASQLALHNQPTKDMEASVLNNIAHIGEDKFTGAITDYMASEDEWLSDEIEEELGTLSESVPLGVIHGKSSGEVQQTKPSYSIANKKRTSVIIILEAMYKAGWIEKTDGSKVTNRDKMISELLEHAFGISNVAITQILQAAKDSSKNKSGIEKYFKELKEALSN